jgi:mono/diheme cytochrome c family protein
MVCGTMVLGMRIAIVVCVVLAAALEAQQTASVWDGVYTAAQAEKGKAAYGKECASCHGQTLGGSGTAPPLAGADFKNNWNGESVDDLFEKIQATMPGDRPGQLSREENADILAYLLSANGFPAGEKVLASDAAALGKIRFEAVRAK